MCQTFSGFEIFFAWEGDITKLRRVFFVSLYQKIPLGEPSWFRKDSGVKNFHGEEGRGVCHGLPLKVFVSQCRKFLSGKPSFFRKIRVSKKLMYKEGTSLFFEFFCLTVSMTFVGKSYSVSVFLRYRKLLRIRTGLYHLLPLKIFCFIVPKVSWMKPYVFFGYQKSLCIRGGANTVFCSVFSVSQCLNLSQGIHSRLKKILVIEKIYAYKRKYHYFPLKFFLSEIAETFCKGNLITFRIFQALQLFMHKRGISMFLLIFLIWLCRKILWGKSSVLLNFSGIEKVSG